MKLVNYLLENDNGIKKNLPTMCRKLVLSVYILRDALFDLSW